MFLNINVKKEQICKIAIQKKQTYVIIKLLKGGEYEHKSCNQIDFRVYFGLHILNRNVFNFV